MVEESVESPGADGAVDNVPFSSVGLEAGQDTLEPLEDVRIQSLRENALSKIHPMTHIHKSVLSRVLTCQIERQTSTSEAYQV